MKVQKVLNRLARALEDRAELRRVARALGSELPRQRLDVLREFRAGLAKLGGAPGSYSLGYLASLLDVTAEYEVSLRQVADESEIQRLAMRKDWREVLLLLREGPRLPSDIATLLRRDRPTITRILKKLRIAGLIQTYASDDLDGRTRPHRLTLHGRRIVDGLDAGISADIENGIRIAVALLRHLGISPSASAAELDAVARAVLEDAGAAAAAVSLWASEAQQAGLIAEFSDQYHLTPANAAPLSGRNEVLWHTIPDLLHQVKERRNEETVPVYVRTNDAWGAWAYALQNDTTGLSRAIVKGDILSRTIEPPPRFDLLYDDPAVIGSDSNIPAMQTLMQQADKKFVVTNSAEDVPEGFVQLAIDPEKD